MHKPQIKLISLQSHKPSHTPQNLPIPQPQSQQLQEYQQQIQTLKEQNRALAEKLAVYEGKFQGFRLVEEELEFRREQERNMMQHLEHFQRVNERLRARVRELEEMLRKKDDERANTIASFLRESELCADSRQAINSTDLHESKHQPRKSLSEAQKQNHPLTPKSRVNINLSNFIRSELDSGPQSKIKRKVFF